MSKTKTESKGYVEVSGNIFADLQVDQPEAYQLKARLASMIYDSIEAKGWTQKHTASVLGITQPDVSNICRGLLDHFSAEKLLTFLARLDNRVTITVKDESKELPPQEIVIAASQPIGEEKWTPKVGQPPKVKALSFQKGEQDEKEKTESLSSVQSESSLRGC